MIKLFSDVASLISATHRKRFYALLALITVGVLLEMMGVGLVIPVIAILTQQDLAAHYPQIQRLLDSVGNPSQRELIVGVMLLFLLVYAIKNVFLAFLAWKQARFTFDQQAALSQRLFSIYLRQPYTFHLQHNSAPLVRNIRTEVGMFTNNVLGPLMHTFSEGLVFAGICLLLLLVEPLGTLVAVVLLGTATFVFYRTTRGHIARWGKARQYHDGQALQHLNQGLGGAKEVKLLGREAEFLDVFGFHTMRTARMNQLQTALRQMPRLWLELLGVVGLVILVLSMLMRGKDINTLLPTLGLFAAAAFRLMPSMSRMLAAVQQLRYGHAAVEVLSKEFKLKVEESKPLAAGRFGDRIDIIGLSYAYPGSSSKSLDQVSITIESGKTIGIIGQSGSGKSTLVDTLLGLLTPGEGQIDIDGVDIQHNLRAWQNEIGYVPQAIYLTDDTLRRNVAFGIPDKEIDDRSVDRAIRAAQMDDFVAGLPDGVETVVGEHGVRLSGGQRQRIGIARALYHDPRVLVLDEATSALDVSTERNVMRAINALHGSKTIIIVAHRLTTVENCDRIYKLEKGKVIAEGTAEEVLT